MNRTTYETYEPHRIDAGPKAEAPRVQIERAVATFVEHWGRLPAAVLVHPTADIDGVYRATDGGDELLFSGVPVRPSRLMSYPGNYGLVIDSRAAAAVIDAANAPIADALEGAS